MDFQDAFNMALGVVLAGAGWWLNTVYKAVCDLAKEDRALAEKLQAVEVLVAGEYIRRIEFENKMDAVFNKLQAIDEKLDRKLEHLGVNK